MSYPKLLFWSPNNGPVTRTLVTVKFEVTAGSAVAVKPWRTQAWPPRATSSPTGRRVMRRLFTADFRIASKP